MFCSNCGNELAPEAKFCSNCGAPVNTGASADAEPRNESSAERRERERREDFEKAWGSSASPSQPESTQPEAEPATELPEPDAGTYSDSTYEGGFADRKPTWETEREQMRTQTTDEWSMPDLGPPAAPRRRRTWLWVLLGIIVFVVIACCVFGWWITATESGTEWFEGIATQAAEEIQNATQEAATPQP